MSHQAFQDAAQKRSQLNMIPPPNYVAGLGRGATGFTTRSDIGPARISAPPEPNFGVAPAGYIPGAGRGATGFGRGGDMPPPGSAPGSLPESALGKRPRDDDDDDDRGDYSESNFDKWEGFSGGLFDASAPYDADDQEADRVWAEVEEKMDSRRKARREERLKQTMEEYRKSRPKIQQQFVDIKKDLATLSEEDWMNIPDIGDYSIRKQKRETYTPVPDSLLEQARRESQQYTSLDIRQQASGLDTPSGLAPTTSGLATPDLRALGEYRETVLSLKLGQASDSVTGQTVVDPRGYITALSNQKITSDAEIGDIKKAGLLLKSVTSTNPSHAPGWIAYARVEEIAGRLASARNIIMKGCDACPKSEDVWLEAARLQTPANAKAVLAKAVRHIPHSVKIWLAAANLETDINAKKRVLRKCLEIIPNSVRVWKEAIELEEEEDARVMLSRAVECVPQSTDLWLALARLETYENAKKVLNKARQAIPTEPLIWITAAELEEAQGGENISDRIEKIIAKAVKSLSAYQVVIDRDQWIKYAERAEEAGHIGTCQAIIKCTIGIGVEEEDRKHTWIEDAEKALKEGRIETARAIYAHALTVFKGKKSLWLRAASLEKQHGTNESLEQLLKKAVTYCPKAEVLWLMAAKHKWLTGDVAAARAILGEAFAANPDNEAIWLAAVKLENENNEHERARILLAKARERASTKQVWMKSAQLEREVAHLMATEAKKKGETVDMASLRAHERELLDEALDKFPDFDKLWMMRGQWEEQCGTKDAARDVYSKGLKNCPHSIPLWLCLVRLEEADNNMVKVRSILDKARLKNPKNPQLWLAAIRTEIKAGNQKIAQQHLSKALQECPDSGILWAEAIEMEPRPQRNAKSVQALKKCDKDAHVIVAIAKLFWSDRKLDKARSWFTRAVALNPDLGDAWAHYYKFELQHGSEDQQRDVVKRCVEADPHHGELWVSVSKRVENMRIGTEAILKKTAALVTVT
eukprot:GEZU01023080.1.p1 GENE.GEZU01023080.1~~GEZU01023080.1.p1  ORF type:complete len:983 (-),score=312.18 GEZU01023080.1:84-3032(-)